MTLSRKAKNNITGYLFIMPNLIGFTVFTLFSVVFSFFISFTNWNMLSPLEFIGLQNYLDQFSDKWVMDSLLNNLYFLLFIPLNIFLALICAVVLNGRIYFSKIIRSVIFLPSITNIVIVSLVWFNLFHPSSGIINNVLMCLGISDPPGWLGSTVWVKPAIVIMNLWGGLGYNMIYYLSGLQGIPGDLYEAANIDGAGRIKQFFHITIPMITPTTFFILIMSIIGNFQMWTNIQVLTNGGPGTSSTVISYYIYRTAFMDMKLGYASSIAWVLFAIILIVTLIQWRGQKKWVNYI